MLADAMRHMPCITMNLHDDRRCGSSLALTTSIEAARLEALLSGEFSRN
jgi:hypothetical protein